MRLLLRSSTGEFSLTKEFVGDDTIPPYAILSHTWGADTEEVTFEDLTNGTGKDKPGYEKIQFCGKQAAQDNLHYFWIDTCCINQASYAELSHAINSMFRWYGNATRCYVYLSDVSSPPSNVNNGFNPLLWERDFRKSKWFTRGWTLQELLAPSSVEFFSQERRRLGDKRSLRQQIHEITGIPDSALQGARLFQFSDNQRFSWMERRQTKLVEDEVYALLGIFDVNIPLNYGEGKKSAFKRLQKEINKLKKCIQDLRLTDPRDDKKRIEDTKGGLLEDSYHWILKNSDFQRWRDDPQSRLLWIKGDPGKGKTMLLCGIIDELNKSMTKTALLSYFFCQATDSRINNAIAVLRGLIYLLVDQQPSLVSHLRKKHDYAGKALFEDANAWVALSDIFTNILQDPNLNSTYLIIDGLDECIADLPKLLDFVVQNSSISSRVQWMVSSRNRPDIKERLEREGHSVRLCLELEAKSISTAVDIFIQYKVHQLVQRKKYDNKTRDTVLDYLSLNANNTFLWVALVCQTLEKTLRWNVLAKLNAFPPGLNSLYERMMEQICNSDDADLYKWMLALITTVYRPITLKELTSLVQMPEDIANDLESLREIISLCGSFLVIREDTIYLVHQSTKDFLFTKAFNEIFPSGREEAHYIIFSRSLQAMSRTLRRDIYSLRALGYPIKRVVRPDPDPLATIRYSCIYWVDHLCDWNLNSVNHSVDLQHGGVVDSFVRKKYLYWLEALSLCKSMSKGVVSMERLETLIQRRAGAPRLIELVRDARRFIIYHKHAIKNSPLQAYASALMFSPAQSQIRCLYKKEEPKCITTKPAMGDKWSVCLQTLEGHRDLVNSVAFSYDSIRLASASNDYTVKIWDASTGECLQTLEDYHHLIKSVAFSHDSAWLASASGQRIKIWDASSGECLQTLEGHKHIVDSVVFSHDSAWLASASYDGTMKIWDAGSGKCLQTLKHRHGAFIYSAAFSHDSVRLASASRDRTIKIWRASSGKCLRTLKGHGNIVRSVTFSHSSTWLASASCDKTIKIWDASSGKCLRTLKGHSDLVNSVAFSHDSARLASASEDRTIKIWDASSGECLQTLKGHSGIVRSVTFSHDSTWLASASGDRTVKIWDASSDGYLEDCDEYLEDYNSKVESVAFSHDSTRLASVSGDWMIKIWDTSSGKCLQTLEDHSDWGSDWESDIFNLVAFSYDFTRLASALDDESINIWDISSGKCLQTLKGHDDLVYSVAFSYDSTRLASASRDEMIKIWDASSGECLQTLKGHSDSVHSVVFSHESTQLASASCDETIKIWDASSGECLQTLKSHSNLDSDFFISVVFSHDSTRLASALEDGTIKVWGASSGDCLQTLEGHSDSIHSVTFSHNSARLASASDDRTVKIWDISSGECLQTLKGHNSWVYSVAFSHDSIQLASASRDCTIKIWDASSGECLQTLESDNSWVRSVAFSHNSARLASASNDETIQIWDTSNGECLQTLKDHSDSESDSESDFNIDLFYLVAFSYDSTRLASASWDKTIKIWDSSSGECLQTLKGHNREVYSVVFSYDSTRLASALDDGTIKIWDVSSGKCLQTLKGHSGPVHSVVFSHDSTWLASTSWDETIKIWDASSGKCLQTLEDHDDIINSITFSHDSTRLASASKDKTIKTWDTSSGKCLQTLEGYNDPDSDIYSSDGSSYDTIPLALTSENRTINIWDINSNECLQAPYSDKLSFNTTSLYLDTKIGTIAIDMASDSNIILGVTNPQCLRYQGGGLSLDKAWITYNSEKLVWIPSEYRPVCSAISRKAIGIGTCSGKVWMCYFKSEDA